MSPIASQVAAEQLWYWRREGLSPREMMRALGFRVASAYPIAEEDVRAALVAAWEKLTNPP